MVTGVQVVHHLHGVVVRVAPRDAEVPQVDIRLGHLPLDGRDHPLRQRLPRSYLRQTRSLATTLILVAAMLAFPSGLARKATGILSGVVLIQVVNVIRILALFQVGQWSDTLFDLTHKYLWPALIIVIALGFFLVWVKGTSPGGGDA